MSRRGGHAATAEEDRARRASSIETDYLNGEVVLLGRLHAVATPVNALLQLLANRLACDRGEPASTTSDEFDQLPAPTAHPT
ncbi:MAG: ketopantoate reductase C-terminal domain-containing protein [Actinomycetes bacterium]